MFIYGFVVGDGSLSITFQYSSHLNDQIECELNEQLFNEEEYIDWA